MNHTTKRRITRAVLYGSLVSGLAVPAAKIEAAGHIHGALHQTAATITFHSKGFRVQIPMQVHAGLTSLVWIGNGGAWSGFTLAKLNPGVTQQQFRVAARAQDEEKLSKLGMPLGGLGSTNLATEVVNLTTGRYVVFDSETGPKNKPLLASHFFNVVAGGTNNITAPAAMATWAMKDMKFHLPTTMHAGTDTLKVVNSGPSDHMVVLFHVAPGKTVADVKKYLKAQKGQPPGFPQGGLNTIAANHTAWLTQQFTPGLYAAVCFEMDPKKHMFHYQEGMFASFTVR